MNYKCKHKNSAVTSHWFILIHVTLKSKERTRRRACMRRHSIILQTQMKRLGPRADYCSLEGNQIRNVPVITIALTVCRGKTPGFNNNCIWMWAQGRMLCLILIYIHPWWDVAQFMKQETSDQSHTTSRRFSEDEALHISLCFHICPLKVSQSSLFTTTCSSSSGREKSFIWWPWPRLKCMEASYKKDPSIRKGGGGQWVEGVVCPPPWVEEDNQDVSMKTIRKN